MLKNISISSGSNFSKKIFGSITKPRNPSFIHSGKIFSDNTFKNQRTIPLLENNIYYANHGLIDSDIIIDYSIQASFDNLVIQAFNHNYTILSNSIASIDTRSITALLRSIESNYVGSSSSSINTEDPYDNNPPQCDIP